MRLSDVLRPLDVDVALVLDSTAPQQIATSVTLLVVREIDGLDHVVYDAACSN